ncbi:hypothetical protein BDP27DRAFT_1333243 [Rhodocollybia butyracea]|uniref:Uncharacterized protein n=1 Tax=Rhodocollybia butyracea TaxID=206335 RepID=A0A9P5PJU1_9AGAR|nr:hypothetical protein BDP27DRAFT_1333243 [Rhodocollybia butyracea]
MPLFEESSTLTTIGKNALSTLTGAIIMCVTFGVYIAAAVIALYILSQNGLRKWPVLILSIIQIILILASILQAVDVNAYLLDLLFHVLADSKLDFNQDLEDRMAAFDVQSKIWVGIQGGPGVLSLLLGDTVVLWRAWALWEYHTAVQWMLVILGISNGVIIIGERFSGPSMLAHLDITDPILLLICQNFYFLFSIALNILATVLIAYKTWVHSNARPWHADQHSTQDYSTKLSPSLNVLVFLVESGTAFCIFQAGYCTLGILASSPAFAGVPSLAAVSAIVYDLSVMVVGFYPISVTIVSHLMLYRGASQYPAQGLE